VNKAFDLLTTHEILSGRVWLSSCCLYPEHFDKTSSSEESQCCSDKLNIIALGPPNPPILGGNEPKIWISPPRIGGLGGASARSEYFSEQYCEASQINEGSAIGH
jgi:hypothetical protein